MSESTELEQIEQVLDAPAAASDRDELEQVTELLEGIAPEGATAEEPSGDAETEQEESEAEGSGVDYKQEIPMADGTKVALGELKDHYQQYQAKVDQLQTRENAVMTRYNEVNDLLGYVKNLPPELMQGVQAQQRQYLEQQHALMLEVVPEFKDPAQFKASKESIFELAKSYGVEQIIGQVSHHGIVKMLHDFAQLKKAVRTAKETVKPVRAQEPKGKTGAKSTSALEAAITKAKASKSKDDEIAAINLLIG